MRKATPVAAAAVLALLVVTASLTLTACSRGEPDTAKAQLLGVVTSVDAAGDTPSVLVVWDESLGTRLEYDAASLAVPDSAPTSSSAIPTGHTRGSRRQILR